MKKLISLILLFGLSAILLCGCVRSGVEGVINENDTGTVELSMGIEKKFYDTAISQGEEDIFAGMEVVEFSDGDDTYVGIVETKEFQNLDALEQILLELEYSQPEDGKDYRIFKSAEVAHTSSFLSDKYDFSATTNLQKVEDEGLIKLVVKLTMPGKLESEVGTVDGDSVTFEVSNFDGENVLTASSSSVNYGSILGVTAAVVLLVVLLILIFGKRGTHHE